MCGRFTLFASPADLQRAFGLAEAPDLAPRYNVAPSQDVATVRLVLQEEGRRVVMARWGLVPSWARDASAGNRMINARAETVEDKPAYRAALRRRRCLVLADGFYEWKREGGRKQPYYFCMKDRRPFAFAGLYERWSGPAGEVLESCTILTTSANEVVSGVHERMPVILSPEDHDLWLDPAQQDPQRLLPLLRPFPAGQMTCFPVSTRVNSPARDDPECAAPAASPRGLFDDEE